MANNFCRFLSNGRSLTLIHGEVNVKPCCWSSHIVKFDQKFNQELDRWSKIDSWTPGCSVCKEQEDAGYNSFRQVSFDIIDDVDHNEPVAVDFNIDFSCNSACITCSPGFSTFWQTQMVPFGEKVSATNYQYRGHLTEILKRLNFNELRRLKFFGGEPLLTQSHVRVLQQVPDPTNVQLWYTTNASCLPSDEVFELWQRFSLVFLEFSLDGVGEQFDYIRWPLTWAHVTDTIEKIRQHAPSNVLFRLNHTLTPFNAYYLDRIEDWVHNNLAANRDGDPTEINIHPCWGTFGLDKTPLALRELIYKKYPGKMPSTLLQITQQNNDLSDIKDFIQRWEPIRNNSWKQAFPEIIEYFDF